MEYSQVMPKSVNRFIELVDDKIKELGEREDISSCIIEQFRDQIREVHHLIDRESQLCKDMLLLAKRCKNYERFMNVKGVGQVTAARMCVLLSDPHNFKNGRQFAAYIGLAPMSHGSGGHNITTSIPRINCDRQSRSLLIECANSIARCKQPGSWAAKILARKPKKLALVAIANRLARRLWAMAAKGEDWKEAVVV